MIAEFVRLWTASKESINDAKEELRNKQKTCDSLIGTPSEYLRVVDLESIVSWKKMLLTFIKIRDEDSLKLHNMLKYRYDTTKLVAKQYDAVYKIRNPLLNNVEQEITRKFYL